MRLIHFDNISASQFLLLLWFYVYILPLILQRLWFKTNLKLCKIFFDIGEYGRMSKVTCSFFFGCNSISYFQT